MARRITSTLVRQVLCMRTHQIASANNFSSPPPPETDISYISNRLENVFNIILSDIESSPNPKNIAMLKEPYKYKNKILQELVRNEEFNRNYNIQELIEQEFNLEISDHEFSKFQSLKDIAEYVKQRLEVRKQIPMKTHYANLHLNY